MIIYTLSRRAYDLMTGDDLGAYVPPEPQEGRRHRTEHGIHEIWLCRDTTRYPGVGSGRTRKGARESLRQLLLMVDGVKPMQISKRQMRKLRARGATPVTVKATIETVEVRHA